MKDFANYRKSEIGDKLNFNDVHDMEEEHDIAHVLPLKIFNFCREDMWIYYFHCGVAKFELLKAVKVNVLENT